MGTAKELDQFYTRPEVSLACVKRLRTLLPTLGYGDDLAPVSGAGPLTGVTFIEPSAGTGSFLKALDPGETWVAGDIDPKFPGVLERNFLTEELEVSAPREECVVLGNPPFGKKAALALAFIERGFDYADTVAFVLPIQLRKYITQKRLRADARLIYDELTPEVSFEFNGKPYEVRCVFQVWTLRKTNAITGDPLVDLRQRTAPPTKHPDFEAWIYNATPQAEKVFHEDWEFVILRQGWGDFTPKMRADDPELSKKVQWIFVKPLSERARKNLLSIDYEDLAKRNTSVRGFGKADLVDEYTRRFGPGEPERPALF